MAIFWQGLARSEAGSGRTEEAIGAYKAALAVEGGNHALYSEVIRYCIECKQGEAIREFLDLALEYADQHPEEALSQTLRRSVLNLKEELSWIIPKEGETL